MNPVKIKIMLVALMMVAFIGQVTVASALSCTMDMQQQSTSMDHSAHMMDHSNDLSSETSNDDCCDLNGSCSMSGCITLAIADVIMNSLHNEPVKSIASSNWFAISKTPSSLFRPPILS